MSDQLPMFGPATSGDLSNVTSLPELRSGVTHSGLPAGPTTSPAGREAAPVNHSVQPASRKDSMTTDICGQYGYHSSGNAAHQSFSENKSLPPSGELIVRKRTCKRCKAEKPYSEFYANSKGNRPNTCKECVRKSERIYKRKNPEAIKERWKTWKNMKRGFALSSASGHPFSHALNGFWGNADWLLCTDVRWRPVEPGTFPLDPRAACRRGYGDSLNLQVAKAFIEAVMESICPS